MNLPLFPVPVSVTPTSPEFASVTQSASTTSGRERAQKTRNYSTDPSNGSYSSSKTAAFYDILTLTIINGVLFGRVLG